MPEDLREQLQHTLGDVYRIERELGGGGMSRVFLALETALGRKVVVKVLLPELAAGMSVDRFRREIQLAAQLQHPHIVPLLAAGESGGLPYFTMPFVAGESLRSRLVRERELPVPDAIRILRDVASALAYAHAQGVVHRDIKPDNVLLSHGVAVVTDFGVAKALTASAGLESLPQASGLTSMGVSLGTPAYMAPEQATADPGMDHRVDIYAFGVTAYEILTGEPIFTGRTPHAILGAHLSLAPEPITSRRPGIPPLLALVVMKCLEKRPSDRPQTAGELIAAMDSLTTPSGGTLPIAAVRPPGRRERWRAAASTAARRFGPVAAGLAVAAGIALWAAQRRDESVTGAASPPAVTAAPLDTAPAAAVVPSPDPPPDPPPAAPPAKPSRTPVPTADEKALLTRLRTEAAVARAGAVAAGADSGAIARGDSDLARADSLTSRGRIAAAAAQLTRAAALWSGAADSARAASEPPPVPAVPAESVPPPRAAKPAPAPAPVRPQPPAPAPDPAQQIRALFAEYGAAIEARSLDAIRRTYPGLLPDQAREWEDFFRGVNDVQVELNVTALEIAGDAAEARLAGVYVFTDPGTRRTQRENVAFQASLRREGRRWRIASLR